jgi:putative addiction module killer protein
MHVFLRTDAFDEWLRALRDPIGKARILARLRAAELGHFGDQAAVGEGVFELWRPNHEEARPL